MSYFDPKEEVIDLKLTPYGEYLLSIGKLNPAFYAFFDEDVIYDGNWAGISTEEQNDIETRIQEETPRIHTQTSFSDREKDFTDFKDEEWKLQALYNRRLKQGAILDEEGVALEKLTLGFLKPTVEKRKDFMVQPLGSYKTNSQKAPAWDISFLKTPMLSSTDYLAVTGSTGATNLNIPQLECNLVYKINRNSGLYNEKYKDDETTFTGDIDPDNNSTIFYGDGSTINLVEDALVFRVEEANTNFKIENFEIELFEIVEQSNFVGEEEEYLRPLVFQETTGDIGKITYSVSNFFDLLVDEEIPESEICPLIKKDDKKHVFDTKIFNCEQLTGMGVPQNFYTDIDDTGEVCS